MSDKTFFEETKELFIENINDTYTLNLAISILEDRTELMGENLDLKQERGYYKNIVEELKKYIKREIKYIKMNYSQINGCYFNIDYVLDTYKKVLSKLEELEKGNNYE